jgi:hypothetical protein
VVKGYVQRAGVDFDEVFAPVACMESICTLLARRHMKAGRSTTWM